MGEIYENRADGDVTRHAAENIYKKPSQFSCNFHDLNFKLANLYSEKFIITNNKCGFIGLKSLLGN